MIVYIVTQEHKCDDSYYQTGPSFQGAYASKELAQAAVDDYIEDCKREYQQELDEDTVEIEGREYRRCDLRWVKDDEAAGVRKYKYEPQTEIDMEDFWHRYPEQYIQEVEVQTGESK